MVSAIFNPLYLSHSSSSSSLSPTILRKPSIYASICTSRILSSKTPTIRSLTRVPQLCLTPFSSWNGLRKNGNSISLQTLKLEKRKKREGKGVFASLFGVGAPEALVIGVVALLVFGPKGLADVAKNLGKTLRAFQPTIRELQEVSREFKSTLEKEIGLDELKNPVQGNYTSNSVPPDTLQNSQSTIPKTPATSTEDSQETTTTPAATSEDPAATLETEATPASTPEAPPAATPDTEPTPAASAEDSQPTATTPAATNEDSQPNVDTDVANGSTSSKGYTTEELLRTEEFLRITEEQLMAAAAQKQKEQAPSPTPSSEKNDI